MECGGATEFSPSDRFRIVFLEGGKSLLLVSPSGESLLIDTGFPGSEDRDAKRIAEAAKAAGLKQIDHMVTSHYDGDHVANMTAAAARVPMKNFYDHGDPAVKDEDNSENDNAVGLLFTYGKFRMLDLADLTWNREMEVDVPEQSDRVRGLIHGQPPRQRHLQLARAGRRPALAVAMMDNGARKIGAPSVLKLLNSAPGKQAVYLSHDSVRGAENNPPEESAVRTFPRPTRSDGPVRLLAHH